MTMQNDDNTPDHKDGGFWQDMSGAVGRRRMLGLLGVGAVGVGAWALLGSGAGRASEIAGLAADGTMCVAPPPETAGPYPADGTNVQDGQTINVLTDSGILRPDIRGSFAGLTGTAEGIPLEVEIRLVDVDLNCTPVAGLAFYLWHCDAAGGYSIYSVPGVNYLRGLQVSDATGTVRFTTILPGCYDGRWPHMHFEVFASPDAAVNGDDALLTAQIALPGADIAALFAKDARYAASLPNLSRISLASDNVFSDNTDLQIAQQTLVLSGDANGLKGVLTVALRRS